MIPRETIDALRQQNDVSVEIFGIECVLYIPTSGALLDLDTNDAYGDDSQLAAYTHYTTYVWVEWSPDIKRLRNFGIFTEDEPSLTKPKPSSPMTVPE